MIKINHIPILETENATFILGPFPLLLSHDMIFIGYILKPCLWTISEEVRQLF